MSSKRVYTHMSELAVRGLERLAADRKVKVIASPSGGFTAITEGRKSAASARAVERRERLVG
jgi:hypothetical protein